MSDLDPLSAPLRGKRIIEVGDELVSYAGRLLADLGAEVIKLEMPGGAKSRCDPLLFELHNQGKRSVELDWTDAASLPALRRLGGSCDAVLVAVQPDQHVVGLRPGPKLLWAEPEAVICTVSPYGLTGPQKDWRATPFTSFAGSGQMYPVGPVEGPPLAMPGQQPFDIAGIRAAYLIQAAFILARDGFGGTSIDFSVHEAVTWQRLVIEQFSVSGRIPNRESYFSPPPGGVWQCRDGRVDIAAHAPRHWKIFVDVLGRPEDLAEPLYEDRSMRVQLFDLVASLIEPHMAAVSAPDFVERAQRAGLPCALSFEPGDIAGDEQMIAREFFLTVPDASGCDVRLPGPAFRSAPSLLVPRRAAPRVGADTAALLDESITVTDVVGEQSCDAASLGERYPLSGVRVLSLGTFVAGNVCATAMADLGADVVKIESPRRPEPLRSYYSPDHGDVHEPSGMRTTNTFAGLTTGTRSVAINMDNCGGRELFRRLVAEADLVIENFGPDQMHKWDCGFEALTAIRPGLVMVSMSGYGHTGPRSHYRAYASNIANYLGLTSAWAHDGMHFDFVAGLHAVGAGLAALENVWLGGAGSHVDLAQSEAGAVLMAPIYLKRLNGGDTSVGGPNEVATSVLSGVFACAGSDRWVAIELSDGNITDACRLLELDHAGTTIPTLRDAISSWCLRRTPHQAAMQLQLIGVAASAVQNLEDLWRDPQLRSRGAYRRIDHPDIGAQELPVSPDQVALGLDRTCVPAPRLGEHTAQILNEWMGLSSSEIADLNSAQACWDATRAASTSTVPAAR